MKFAQFIELEETLARNGHTIEELKESIKKGDNPELLLEFWGINKWLGKSKLGNTWIGSRMKNMGLLGKTEKYRKLFEVKIKELSETVSKMLEKYGDSLMDIKKKNKEELKTIIKSDKEDNNHGNLNIFNKTKNKNLKAITDIEKKIIKIVNDSVEKFGAIKSKEIKAILDSKIKNDKTKIKLEEIWEALLMDTKVKLLKQLYEEKILETSASVKFIKELEKEIDREN